jgi:mono/diheme cytochrome c family protein
MKFAATFAAWLVPALLAVPLVAFPALAAHSTMNDEKVAQLFASTCGFCHAEGGRVQGKGPKLMGTTRSDAFIINRIKTGKEGTMPSFEGNLTNSQIKAIIHYIRNLKD